MSSVARPAAALAVAALIFNAFSWGVSWWPFRQIAAQGLHPLWSTTLIFCVAVAVLSVSRPAAWRELLRTPSLWVLVLAAGTTNACFNWAVTTGDVVRVVLLFYLMPIWAVGLAHWLLGERLTAVAGLRVLMALAGAAIVLWPTDGGGWPLPRTTPEWLGVLGGFSFALNNVMLRREAHRSDAARALAMFSGGALVAGGLAWLLGARGMVPPPPALAWGWALGALGLALWFLLANLALQYGASRLPAHATAVVMISEVFFASASAVALGAGRLDLALLAGGALIVIAALLAARG
jgi:drug/metabolite transporter (DMT)-like permease